MCWRVIVDESLLIKILTCDLPGHEMLGLGVLLWQTTHVAAARLSVITD